ncbi:hypothetical protein Goshw_020086 [Gossypium schwendimanii]|uniref:Uncharacterized protein n=1 Tax=Gossypium schwendimanii TaxID=34291 RepID=A0A7J9N059_GOSSC|nr:hypothetical protein [Gossypium schwendimanii]
MHAPPSPLVENYLRKVGFWYMSTVGRGCKGPETYQCFDREVETRDAHIPSSMWGVHYHVGRCQYAIRIAGGRVPSHRVCPI